MLFIFEQCSTNAAQKRCKCKGCGDVFVGGSRQLYCSPECRPSFVAKKTVREFVCECCGKKFESKRKNRFCSKKCSERNKVKPVECKQCGSTFKPTRTNREFCSDGCRTAHRTHICEGCGEEFTKTAVSNSYNRYCSRECAFKHLHAAKGPQQPELAAPSRCKHCGKYYHKTMGNLYCSDDCRDAAKTKYYNSYRESRGRTRKCPTCGKEHFVSGGNGPVTFCSNKCRKIRQKALAREYRRGKPRARNHKDRARRFGVYYEYVNPLDIFRRDKWKCCECGTPVQKKDWLMDNAAELDHIIPMSLGGPHEPSNLQCLCRRCNGNKSNNYTGQLVLSI